jgi:hypothetical protein
MAWWWDYAGVFDWDCLLPMVLKFSDFISRGLKCRGQNNRNLPIDAEIRNT